MLRLKSSRTPGLRLLRTWPITVAGGEGEGEFWYDGDILWKGEDKEHENNLNLIPLSVLPGNPWQYMSIHVMVESCMGLNLKLFLKHVTCILIFLDFLYSFVCFDTFIENHDLGNLSRIDGDVLKKELFWDFWGRCERLLLESLCHRKKFHLPNPATLDLPVVWPQDGYGSCKSWPDDADIGKEGEVRSPQERCGCYRAEEMGRTDSPL